MTYDMLLLLMHGMISSFHDVSYLHQFIALEECSPSADLFIRKSNTYVNDK